ncbi:hypothetical protein GCM10011611_65230 [Aliidongia dinghuensis]|uniref:Uncharacterized protein n=1 Tax=Aliidongia dinghuensis TaxID=1867774 RepID=A0A8J2Z0B7_9PROT|nr:hypothetical protein GCM10011611_65230 [Aliidongia dinghuensis]
MPGDPVEIARCWPEGIVTQGIVARWGKVMPAQTAKAWDVHPSRRERIQAMNIQAMNTADHAAAFGATLRP